jgi:hypothetical protein
MAITLNGRTKLNNEIEKIFVQLGGYDPNKTLTKQELGQALVNAFDRLEAAGRQDILDKIYVQVQKSRPDLPTLEEIELMDAVERDLSSST